MTLWQIRLPYATFGICAHNGRVVDAAPIGSWMVGKPLGTVDRWVQGRRGTLTMIHVEIP